MTSFASIISVLKQPRFFFLLLTVGGLAAQSTAAGTWNRQETDDEAATFFDDSYVHDLYIRFDNADWYTVLYNSHANDAEDPYFPADFECDGIVIENVGVRFKGNSSFRGSGVKKSLKIDFDEYDEDNAELNFYGLKKLNLNNNTNDPTMLHEKLFLDFASNFLAGVGRAVHTNVYINGELWGLYTAVEQIDKTFVQSRFGSDEDGNLYKGEASDDLDNPQGSFGSDLTWLGDDETAYDDFYQLKTNETAYDYSGLVEFIDVLNNTPTADLPESIEPLLDVDDALAGMALNNLFANLDSYSGSAHNYYLYERDDTGRFTHIPWDVNESFGTFNQFTSPGQDMARLSPLWLPAAMGRPGQTSSESRPLMENLWAVDSYRQAYLRDLAEMLRNGFDAASATIRINELADLIRDDVYADPNKPYTTAAFEVNLTTDIQSGRTIPGLLSLVEERSTYLDAALDAYASKSDLALNELMAVNTTTVQDESGDFDPWVEIINPGPGLIEVTGLYLTDDAENLTKWALPSVDLDDGEYLTLWLDGEAGEGNNHVSFSLSATGGTLELTDGVTVLDSITYPALNANSSLARVPDAVGDFMVTDRPTFASANLAPLVSNEAVEVTINEFMADNDSIIEDPDEAGAFEDWIELYNSGTEVIDLSGMFLTDDATDPTQWQFAEGTTIAAGGFLLIWADGDTDQGANHTSFKLSAGGETIALFHTDGTTLIDLVEFGEQETDVSMGRSPDGSEIFVTLSTPTPGAVSGGAIDSNIAPTANTSGPYTGGIDAAIPVDGSASTDADGTIELYEWDLDYDGEYDDATGVTAIFTQSTAGIHIIGLRVTDNDGNTGTGTAGVTISDGDAGEIQESEGIVNLSVRAYAGNGAEALILGFVVEGTHQNSILVRGVGPGLTAFGVDGAMEDPGLDLYLHAEGTSTLLGEIDDWSDAANSTEVVDTTEQVGAFPLAEGSKDVALHATLLTGVYTTHIAPSSGSGGFVLAELYSVGSTGSAHLVNASAGASIGAGDQILIAGIVITGDEPVTVLIRGIGPALESFGVSGALVDPKLELYESTTVEGETSDVLYASNDNWIDDAAQASAVAAVGGFELPSGSKDATLLLTLEPGVYTAHLSGVDGTSGIALVEIYEVL